MWLTLHTRSLAVCRARGFRRAPLRWRVRQFVKMPRWQFSGLGAPAPPVAVVTVSATERPMDIVNFNAVALVVDTIGVVGAVAVIVAYGLLPKYRTHPAPIILLIAICDALMVMSICLL